MKEFQKTPYEESRLVDWLKKDTWSAQEAVCLLSDIDPTGVLIDWDGFTNAYGGHVDSPKIERGQLLCEGTDFGFDEEMMRVIEIISGPVDEPFITAEEVCTKPFNKLRRVDYRLKAESGLRKLWDLYRRSPDHDEDDQRPPSEFIEWAKAQGLDIPWISWADENGLLHETGEADAASISNSAKLPTRERNTLLVVIAALCRANSIDYERRGIAKKLVGLVDEIGMSISDDTVRKILKDIPQALD